MSTQPPVSSDSIELHDLMGDWQRALHAFGVDEIVVLGPDLFAGADARRVLAVYPTEAHAAAQSLAASVDFGALWDRARASLIAWQHLSRPLASDPADGEAGWREAWHARGAQTVIRVGFTLPAARAFECFLFSVHELDGRAEVAALAWSALNIWPALRAALVAVHCPLTPRELQCLTLAFDGLTARASAERMACTERTVNFHLANAMTKLRADNKMAAIQRACWLGAI